MGSVVRPPLFEVEGKAVRNLVLTQEKIIALWQELEKYPAIFSDQTRGNFELFTYMLTRPDSIWLEIDESGIFYATEVVQDVSLNAHAVFFDRDVASKTNVVREIMKWLFIETGVHRMSADVPETHYATKRLLERLGFKYEGNRREVITQRGKWVNLILFGILQSEAKAKWDF